MLAEAIASALEVRAYIAGRSVAVAFILGFPWWLMKKKPHLRSHAPLLHCMGL